MADLNGNQYFRNPALAAFAAWLVPGAGFWLLGERTRGLIVGSCITLCFWFGLLIGGAANVIDRQDQFLWYLAQMVTGVHLFLGEILAGLAHQPTTGGKSVDLGLVFSGVAGLLNLVAILETFGRAFPPVAALPRPEEKP